MAFSNSKNKGLYRAISLEQKSSANNFNPDRLNN
jgi:hypothetical protein